MYNLLKSNDVKTYATNQIPVTQDTGCSAKKNTLLATHYSADRQAIVQVSTPIDAPTPLVSVEHRKFSVWWFWGELEQFENRHFLGIFSNFFQNGDYIVTIVTP